LRRLAVFLAACAALLATVPAQAAEPPNENDPCSREGRNVCGTTGVGFYDTYRYGVRWFGDFRGAVADAARTFCIDLRFWYPSKSMRFQLAEPDQLRNRDGDTVTYERQRRMAYAAWTYGRTNSPNQQAAVMLYVHSQMGDAQPGEVDPSTISPAVAAISRHQHRPQHGRRGEASAPGRSERSCARVHQIIGHRRARDAGRDRCREGRACRAPERASNVVVA
jgi:hypothetical protein